MLLPRASDLDEEPTIDWNKVLDNMQGTPLNVKFKLAVCPNGRSSRVDNGLFPSSVYAQSNVFLCALSLYNITVIC